MTIHQKLELIGFHCKKGIFLINYRYKEYSIYYSSDKFSSHDPTWTLYKGDNTFEFNDNKMNTYINNEFHIELREQQINRILDNQ